MIGTEKDSLHSSDRWYDRNVGVGHKIFFSKPGKKASFLAENRKRCDRIDACLF